MVDFLRIEKRLTKNGTWEVYPKFEVNNRSRDLMVRGKDFYAVWLEDKKMWSTDEQDLIDLVDHEIDVFKEANSDTCPHAHALYLRDGDTKMIDKWHHYCKDQCRTNAKELDDNLIFADKELTRQDYASKKLNYSLERGDISAYDRLMSVLYSDEERHKIEWAIGSIISGDSKKNQKFLVMYGEPKTGKSTVLNIIQKLFDGYWVPFDAKVLSSGNNAFAMEAFRTNPLVAIQHDGDLSRIEDNTRLNSIVSHETMLINEKFKSAYPIKLKTFLFMGTNKPVKITDAKSGLLRRLIDVTPTGEKVPKREYDQLIRNIEYELGAIAAHCLDIYNNNPSVYDDYIPIGMLQVTNDFFNFMVDNYYDFKEMPGITSSAAWKRYHDYCAEMEIAHPLQYRIFREEFRAYWEKYEERACLEDGSRPRNWYTGFRTDKFEKNRKKVSVKEEEKSWIIFEKQPSLFDSDYADCLAQLATVESERPMYRWANCKTHLSEIDTHKLHYVKVPENHIVIDFDIPGDDGKKSLERNLAEASTWPATYAELSKSGAGIHLHYIYQGDVTRLSSKVKEHVECKVFTGNSSLRRKLTMCNMIKIATISSGLPLKKERKEKSQLQIGDENHLRIMIEKNLNKEFHGDTSSSINFINTLLDEAYENGIAYDFTVKKEGEDICLKDRIIEFAKGSHNQKDRCVKVTRDMKFKGKEEVLATNQDKMNFEKELIDKIRDCTDVERQDVIGSLEVVKDILNEAYESGKSYDLSSMKNSLIAFAQGSRHHTSDCLKTVSNLHLLGKPNEAEKLASIGMGDSWDEIKDYGKERTDGEIIFFDVEVFPNLFVLCWKIIDQDKVHKMINPTPTQVESLLKFKLVGFNCRRYDNHILWAKMMGYTNQQLYNLSQKIIKGEKNCFFGEAYNLSYTDIYDFANGDNKTSLKKLEIKMKIHHDELGIPWDKPVPEWAVIMNDHYIPAGDPELEAKESHTNLDIEKVNLWERVAEYCCNDVMATESAFKYLKADWVARQILANLTNSSVNDTSNTLTTKLIFGKERNTQHELNWRDLGDMSYVLPFGDTDDCPDIYDREWTKFDAYGRPVFPGYKFEMGKSSYRGEDPSEGGYVYAEPGIYGNVALLDIASMHPSSIIAEELFGKYTENYKDLVQARLNIKHQDWEKLSKMFDGKLDPYIDKVKAGEMTSKQLANAIKIPINSVYGLTSASFSNPFKDERNKDNIVAKRGALFMINLKHEVQRQGFKVAHIKTDSIKIPDATPEIIEFVMDYGKMYGYTFEHEATYEKMCLVNDAVYIAKYADGPHKFELPTGEVVETPWTATGTEFQVSYIFKKLFSHDPINFDDLCITNSATTALYLDMNEGYPDVEAEEKELKKLATKYRKGEISDITWEKESKPLEEAIAKGHNYIFIGKVGQFCPVKEGCGGGLLMREKDGKYYAVGGSKGYRWKESELLRKLGKEDEVDMSYFDEMAHNAMGHIVAFGDFGWFASDDPYVGPDFVPGEIMSYPDPNWYKDGDIPFGEPAGDFMNPPIE